MNQSKGGEDGDETEPEKDVVGPGMRESSKLARSVVLVIKAGPCQTDAAKSEVDILW